MFFFKNNEWFALNTWKHSSLNFNQLVSIIIKIFLFFIYVILISIINNFFSKSIMFHVMWAFMGYWLLSTFIFLFKKSQYTIYTRIIQRFWKRALYLFWILEVNLFLIYLYLTLISPQESLYMMDYAYLYNQYIFQLKSFFNLILTLVTILLISNITILLYKYNSFNSVFIIILSILLLTILYEDSVQFYYINQLYTNLQWSYDDKDDIWELENSVIRLRPYLNYLYLLVFLKLWHTVFIVIFFWFFEIHTFSLKSTSFNVLAAQHQNFYFLLFFGFILKIVFLKNYMNYLYEYVYYWFFVNYHFFDLSYIYYLFNINYITFFINDLFI